MSVSAYAAGTIVPVKQPSGMSCWAAMYTMMYSWKHQVSVSIETAVAELGQHYLDVYRADSGLSIDENRELANAAGMVAENLYNPSPEGWASLIRNNGLLWTSYAWENRNAAGAVTRRGRHIIIFHGIEGDGSGDGTTIYYVDPGDGQFHSMSLARAVGQHELGFTITGLTDRQLRAFSQIMHYP